MTDRMATVCAMTRLFLACLSGLFCPQDAALDDRQKGNGMRYDTSSDVSFKCTRHNIESSKDKLTKTTTATTTTTTITIMMMMMMMVMTMIALKGANRDVFNLLTAP